MSQGVGERKSAVMVSFRDRFAISPQFEALFREGMTLVEETACYLDREGRVESRQLAPQANALFSQESMRLTARLMQIASWLLARRAITNGELSPAEVSNNRRAIRLTPQSRDETEGFADLPQTFQRLIAHSHRLHDRVCRLDRMMMEVKPQVAVRSPIGPHIERIRLAFPA